MLRTISSLVYIFFSSFLHIELQLKQRLSLISHNCLKPDSIILPSGGEYNMKTEESELGLLADIVTHTVMFPWSETYVRPNFDSN